MFYWKLFAFSVTQWMLAVWSLVPLFWTQLIHQENNPTYTLEKEMATHSSTLAWKIPRTEEPGGLQSMASQRVRHDWMTSLSLLIILEWSAISFSRRAFQPRDRSWVSCIGWWIIYHWATRETIAYQRYILNIRTKRLRENEKYIHEKTNQKKN